MFGGQFIDQVSQGEMGMRGGAVGCDPQRQGQVAAQLG